MFSFLWSLIANHLLATIGFVGACFFAVRHWYKRQKALLTIPEGASYNRQSVPTKNDPLARRNPLLKTDEPIALFDPAVTTLYDAFLHGTDASQNGGCLGYRPTTNEPYFFLSYTDVFRHAKHFASALVNEGVKPGQETFVGIYAKNMPEWMIACLGCITQSIVIVPLYDTLGPDAITHIVLQSEMCAVVCDTRKAAQTLMDISGDIPSIKLIIVVEELDKELTEKAASKGITLRHFKTFEKSGEAHPVATRPPRPEHLYIVCYTSGTTGLPKGVMISHANMVATVANMVKMDHDFNLQLYRPGDSVISFLPLAHMFDQLVNWMALYMGGRVGYFSGSILTLMSDMQQLRPTFFPVVPRLLNRLYDQVNVGLKKSNPFSRWLFNVAYQAKLKELKQQIVRNNSIWDKLVFRKIQSQFGGQVRFMATGSAPIAAEVLEFCRVVLGANILEAYGMTETCAAGTASWPGDHEGGHVGGPMSCALVKLEDCPELKYFAKDGKGEVMFKGPSITKGYFKDPAKTAELLNEDGWLHTGDVGMWLPTGALKIIDRKKHIFKLAQGEYVAPEKIESVYVRASIVSQVYVDGDSLERFLVAIVVPEESLMRKWYAGQFGSADGLSLEDLCAHADVKKHIFAEMVDVGKQNKLNSIEQVKTIFVSPEAFTVENELLTPTLKNKRPQLKQRYADIIKKLYDENR